MSSRPGLWELGTPSRDAGDGGRLEVVEWFYVFFVGLLLRVCLVLGVF